MRVAGWLRLLQHLSLALAGACLVEAETFFLPDLGWLLIPFLLLIGLSWLSNRRWVLPAWAANLLVLALAVGVGVWVGIRLADPDPWMENMPIPAAVVPHLGPLLMGLLLVRLFRPRAQGNFWPLQAMGLFQVGLGCVLGGTSLFGTLLAGYVLCALACLTAHYLVEGQQARVPGALPSYPPPRMPLAGSLLRTLSIGAAAFLLFLMTPRLDALGRNPLTQLAHGQLTAQVGYAEEINLNQTDPLNVNEEEAFTVVAEARGQPKLDLDSQQRWRGMVLDRYDKGKWHSLLRRSRGWRRSDPEQLPDLGPNQFFLTFTVQPRQAGGLPLAEPIRLGPPGTPLPVAQLNVSGPHRPLFFVFSGTMLPYSSHGEREYQYRQVLTPPARDGRLPAEDLDPWYVEWLTFQNLPGLEEWTAQLLRRLADDSRYGLNPARFKPDEEGGDQDLIPLPDQWERVARALALYLAASGDYTYTLDSRRHDPNLDPVLDFLWNVRQGYCERYATTLALMLRSQGIPARVVMGFRGVENQGDGSYVVRQSQAHSWVEVLVPRRGGSVNAYDWLSVDPTPATDGPPRPSFSFARLWQNTQRLGLILWHDLIVDYDGSRQLDLWLSLVPDRRMVGRVGRTLGLPALGGLVLLAGAALWRRRWRRREHPRASLSGPDVPFFARLVALLARHTGLRPGPAQTAREFGAAARQVLASIPAAAGLAHLPEEAAELFYRVRFGGRALSAAEEQAIEAQLARLAGVLRQTASG